MSHYRSFARGRTTVRKPGVMNKLEAQWGEVLEMRKLQAEVLWYEFDALKLRLADKTFYTPDFFVMNKDGELEVHEVKGFWEDDARVKIKVAARLYPFKFVAIQYKKKQWTFEEF